MTFQSELGRILEEVIKEKGLSSPHKPISAELQIFIGALVEKANKVKLVPPPAIRT